MKNNIPGMFPWQAPSEPVALIDLPFDILSRICAEIGLESLQSVLRSCHFFRDTIAKRLVRLHVKLDYQLITGIRDSRGHLDLSAFESLEELRVDGVGTIGYMTLGLELSPLCRLISMDLREIDIPDKYWKRICSQSSSLQAVTLRGCTALRTLPFRATGVQSLELADAPHLTAKTLNRFLDGVSGLRRLKLSDIMTNLSSLKVSSRELRKLSLQNVRGVDENCVRSIVRDNQKIFSLELNSLGSLTALGSETVAALPQTVRKLCLYGCDISAEEVTAVLRKCTNLVKLKFHRDWRCEFDPFANASYGSMPIRKLEISNAEVDDGAMGRILDRLPELEMLRLTQIGSLCSLHAEGRHLRSLVLSHCADLSTAVVDGTGLQRLTVTGCPDFEESSIHVLVDSHPNLVRLSLENNPRLRTLKIKAKHLEYLSVATSQALYILDVKAPRLSCLQISHCTALRHLAVMSDWRNRLHVLSEHVRIAYNDQHQHWMLEPSIPVQDIESLEIDARQSVPVTGLPEPSP